MNFFETFGLGGTKSLPIRQFIATEHDRELFIESIKNRNSDIFLDIILKYKKPTLLESLINVLDQFNNNKITAEVVFLKSHKNAKETERPVWEYHGRFFLQWIHLLGKTYGWKLEDILELDVNKSAYLIQEIMIDEQLDREWTYQLSELAYKYDPATKKSKFVPLARPFWMDKKSTAVIEKQKIPKRLLPFGVTVISGVEDYNVEKYISE